MFVLRKNVSSATGGLNVLYIMVRFNWSIVYSSLLFPYKFSVCMIYPMFKVGYWNPLVLLRRCGKNTEELYKKDLHDPDTTMV